MTPEVGIGIVGYGMMGRAHAYGYTVAPSVRDLPVRPRLRAISGHPILLERLIFVVGDRAVIARPPERLLDLL